MKISVITVAYNSATTIARTLHSVASQHHAEIEHIVIDGGSQDGTVAQVHLHGQHVQKLVSEPDHGIYDAMNKGIAAATGDIVGFLNADDHYTHPGVLAKVHQIFVDTQLDMVFGDVAFFHSAKPDQPIRRYRSDRFRPSRISWGWMPAHPALFVRRSVFESAGPFQMGYRIAGDFEWVARAFQNKTLRYAYLPEVLVHMQTGGISTQGWRSTLLLNREVMRACRDNGIATNWFKILSKYPFKLWEYVRP
nr:glycosyltransferase family 2 protein [uncultured Albidiferax sp.]